MPLILSATCKTCATGAIPADAEYCPTCGRRRGWFETPRGRRRAGLVAGAVVLLIAAGVVGLLSTARHTTAGSVAVVTRTAARPPVSASPPPNESQPDRPTVPAPAPLPILPPPATEPAGVSDVPVPSVPSRPGDTDLTVIPLAAYAGGPSADHLSVRGVRLGLAVADIPPALIAERSPARLKDVAGNEYVVDGEGRIEEIRVREPGIIDRMPIDGTHALLSRFGDPDRPPIDVGAEMFVLVYAARGLQVRWDDGVGHLDQVTLVAPRPTP